MPALELLHAQGYDSPKQRPAAASVLLPQTRLLLHSLRPQRGASLQPVLEGLRPLPRETAGSS